MASSVCSSSARCISGTDTEQPFTCLRANHPRHHHHYYHDHSHRHYHLHHAVSEVRHSSWRLGRTRAVLLSHLLTPPGDPRPKIPAGVGDRRGIDFQWKNVSYF